VMMAMPRCESPVGLLYAYDASGKDVLPKSGFVAPRCVNIRVRVWVFAHNLATFSKPNITECLEPTILATFRTKTLAGDKIRRDGRFAGIGDLKE
jgi:hypothetical protein